MRAVALQKNDQRRVAYLSRRKDGYARQFLLGCPDSRVPFKPLEFQVAVRRAFGVPLTFIKALAGQTMRYGDKNEHSFVIDRYGNRIMAQTKCKGDHTCTLYNALQAAVAVSLRLCCAVFCLGQRAKGTSRRRACSEISSTLSRGRATRRRPLEGSPRRKGRLAGSSLVL